ncbi:MAG TPA: DivIVA domain-containing protein, partial [Actinomycetota bacterium]|nr:DivIVA domain-containing protein [Actinomycetota bacterium]
MSLTPEDIQGKRFHDAFRGYNHEEVDVFLDEVAANFTAVFQELQGARTQITELEAQLADVKGTEGMLKRTLLAAQRAADDAVAEAKAEAARLVAAAESSGADVIAAASRRADGIISDANARQAQIEATGARLRELDAQHRATLRAHLEAQLRALDDLPLPPVAASGPVIF